MVELAPNDMESRRRLVDTLIEADLIDEACRHVDVLLDQSPDEPSILVLAMQVASMAGNRIQEARLKRRLKNYLDGDVSVESVGASALLAGRHPAHPSEEGVSELSRNLRLVRGGTSSVSTSLRRTPLRKLTDVAGLTTVKRNLVEMIESVQSYQLGSGGDWLGGTLLYGPPSCGKAFCAEVVASELDALFWYFDLTEQWSGEDLNEAVGDAIKDSSTGKPAVLYFNNVDSATSAMLEPLLVRLDAARRTGPVVVLGAATFPWLVSTSLVRPGRLGKVLLVLPPDAPARRLFLEDRLRRRTVVDDDEIEWTVAHTEGHSFGDIERLLDMALAESLTDDSRTNETVRVTHAALRQARQHVSASSADWLTTAGHHALMNEGGGLYDDLLQYFHSRQKH